MNNPRIPALTVSTTPWRRSILGGMRHDAGRRMLPRPDLRGRALVGAALALVLLAACGTSNYRYIDNAKESTFFKVPSSWTVFRQQAAQPTDRASSTVATTTAGPWTVVVDAAPKPDVAHADDRYPAFPVVRAEIGTLGQQGHDILSIAELRKFSTDFKLDPIDAANTGDPTVEVVSYKEITTASGVRGVHLVFNWQADGQRWVTIDESAYVDVKTTRVYRLAIRCESKCFKDNRATIDAIASSWQVRA